MKTECNCGHSHVEDGAPTCCVILKGATEPCGKKAAARVWDRVYPASMVGEKVVPLQIWERFYCYEHAPYFHEATKSLNMNWQVLPE